MAYYVIGNDIIEGLMILELTGTVRRVERKELKYSIMNLSVDCLLRSSSVEWSG